MTKILHRADSRGLADHGWLVSRHSFSFADYHNPQRMQFGLLRVLNDDIVQPALGFPTHPHENMEIVSIPLSGSLRHQDSMGNQHVIRTGEVQIMSAGSGLTHSEYNNSAQEEVNFLQIWVYPKQKNIAPRYGQQLFNRAERQNRFQLLVSPAAADETIWINQDAWFSLIELDAGATASYQQQGVGTGLYCLVIEGQLQVDTTRLERRDGLGLTLSERVPIVAESAAQLLCIEVPLASN